MNNKTHIKLVHELHGACVYVQCEELSINHLITPLHVVTHTLRLWALVAGRLC